MGKFKIGSKVRYKEKLWVTGTIVSEAIPYKNREYSRLVSLDIPLVASDVTIKTLPFRECNLELMPEQLKVGDKVYIVEEKCTGVIERIIGTEAVISLTHPLYNPNIPLMFRYVFESLSLCKRIKET